MPLGERFRGGGAHGIARFLEEHQHCDAGFDVRRDDAPGSGKLTITCQGCGETVSYNAAEAGGIAAFGLPGESSAQVGQTEPIESGAPAPAAAANGARPPAEPAAEGGGTGPPGPGAPRAERPGGPPRWLAPAAIGLVIAAGIAMIAIGLFRSDDEPEPSEQPPAPTQAEQPAQGGQDEPEQPAPSDAAETPPPATGGAALRDRSFGTFTIGVPAGWSADTEPDGATLQAPGSTAAVTVLAGRSTMSPLEFARESEAFLANRHPGASVGEPKPVRFQGRPAARAVVRYPGGEEQATFVSSGGTVYALIKRVERGASATVSGEADAVLASFAPR